MNVDVINDCITLAIEKKASKIINEYVDNWSNGVKLQDYKIEQLDSKYYYLIYAHNNNLVDIFNYSKSIFTTLFLVL